VKRSSLAGCRDNTPLRKASTRVPENLLRQINHCFALYDDILMYSKLGLLSILKSLTGAEAPNDVG
jgi:hypothetical protein